MARLDKFAKETADQLALPDQETGAPPRARLTSADGARGLWHSFTDDDRLGSYQRAQVREQLSGAPPYSQSKREEEGQGSLFNVNTGRARTIVDAAQSGAMDIFASDRNIVNIPLSKNVPKNVKVGYQRCIEDRFTEMIRGWEPFGGRVANLCYAWAADGIGVAFFEDATTWKIGSASLSEIKFPSRCEPVSSLIPQAIMKKTLHVGELWRKIENEEASKEEGWNRDAVIAAIHTAGSAKNNDWKNWEKLLEDLKANEAHVANTIEPIEILYVFIEEVDGAVSFYTCAANGGGRKDPTGFTSGGSDANGFMQIQERKYKSMNEAFQVFPYGVGENNRLYTVRGMGYFVYQSANAENILFSDSLNAAKMNAFPVFQYSGTEAQEDATFEDLGFASLIGPGVSPVDAKLSDKDIRKNLGPAMDMVNKSLGEVSGGLSEGIQFSGRENQDSVSASLTQLNAMNAAAISSFYPPLDRLFKEQVRRVFKLKSDTPESKEMKRKLFEEDHIPKEVLDHIVFEDVKAFRLLGGGNKANRLQTLEKTRAQLYGAMDAEGRKESDYDLAMELGSKESADRYIGAPEHTRTTFDASLAELENFHLLEGAQIEPKDGQDHLVHIREHMEELTVSVEAVEQGQLDLVEYTLRNLPLYEHVQKTLAMIVPTPIIETEVKELTRQVQNLKGFFDNGMKAAQKQANEEQEAAAQGAQQEQDPEAQGRQQEEQMKIEAFQRDQNRKDIESEATIRRKDAESAAGIAMKNASSSADNLRK